VIQYLPVESEFAEREESRDPGVVTEAEIGAGSDALEKRPQLTAPIAGS
jgi:hypothetical protein